MSAGGKHKGLTNSPSLKCGNLSDLSNMHLTCTSRVPTDRG
jgi:hypothetical protein